MKKNRRNPQPSPTAPARSRAPKGWLLAACLYLIVLQPLLSVVIPVVTYDEFRLPAREFTFMLVTSIDAWWHVFVAAIGIWCGVALWKGRPGAAKAVKVYLTTCLLTAVALVALPVLIPFESFLRRAIHIQQAFLFFQMLAVFGVGYFYFTRAPRVKSAAGEISPLDRRWKPAGLIGPGFVGAAVVLGIGCSIAAFHRAPLNIFQAAWNGDLKAVQRFVAAGVDVNALAPNRDTALHLAATGDIAEFLAGTSSEIEESYLLKPDDIKDLPRLVTRLQLHSDPVSRMLWDRFSPAARDMISNPSAFWQQDLPPAVMQELNRIIRTNLAFESREFANANLSPATLALASGDPTGVRRLNFNRHLLEETYPQEIAKYQIDARNLLKETPLHIAAFNGRVDVASVLVSRGAHLNALAWRSDQCYWTPLDYALFARTKNRSGNVDGVITLLVNHGAAVNVPQHQWMLRNTARN